MVWDGKFVIFVTGVMVMAGFSTGFVVRFIGMSSICSVSGWLFAAKYQMFM